ncbi:uncharacterized protein YoxC [Planomicrobium soli]|uniref:Uncharacterized protein YoxC n=1 Tax=Planomicrobium soli TaxID=1176648 RepID=A0A2P8H271_9BACL|nr:DUF948 domain-containing protein [Planomicrobium soli]PSL40314.1 uncharacterized protein YoxC [Planomicrobium soli]
MSSTVWLYIALAIFVIALIIAGIGVGIFVSGMKGPMKKIKGSVDNLKDRIDKLNLEATSLQHHANELKEDMQAKSEKVTLLIDAARGTKNSFLDLNSSVRTVTVGIASSANRDKRNISQINQWKNATSDLLDLQEFLKNRKNDPAAYYPTPLIGDEQTAEK